MLCRISLLMALVVSFSAKDRPTFSHMLDFYPQQIARMGIQIVWQRSPVSLETCWVPGFWKERGWDVDYILNQALRWHVSSVNVKSSPIPVEWQSKFEEFQKRMGYRVKTKRRKVICRLGRVACPRSRSNATQLCKFAEFGRRIQD